MVKQGYKQTEIGVIPEDWEVKFVKEFTDCTAGGTPSTQIKEYWNGNIPWMNSGELNKKKVYDVDNSITELGYNNSSTKLIPEKCVLIGLAGQGKTRGTVAINFVELCINQSIGAFLPSKQYITEYLFYNLENRYEEIRGLSSGDGGRGGLNLQILKSLQIPLPPLAEQEAIATALSDADAWIESLEQLIAKKRLIKQGAMQELLTPKDGWEVKKVRELAKVGRGRVISHKEINGSQIKKYPVYSSQTTNNGIMGFIDTYDFDGEYVTWTTDGEKAGTVFHRIGKFNCTNVCGTIQLFNDNAKFISYILGAITPKHVSRNLANPKLMNEPMKNIELFIPTLSEQTRIATILSDMDAEIEALEQQLAKARQIKQGMMQELLTGRIRL